MTFRLRILDVILAASAVIGIYAFTAIRLLITWLASHPHFERLLVYFGLWKLLGLACLLAMYACIRLAHLKMSSRASVTFGLLTVGVFVLFPVIRGVDGVLSFRLGGINELEGVSQTEYLWCRGPSTSEIDLHGCQRISWIESFSWMSGSMSSWKLKITRDAFDEFLVRNQTLRSYSDIKLVPCNGMPLKELRRPPGALESDWWKLPSEKRVSQQYCWRTGDASTLGRLVYDKYTETAWVTVAW